MSENLGLGNRAFGFFSADPELRMLSQGRNMQLLNAITYTDPDGKIWDAAIGDIIDGASIPRELWTLYGGPFEGIYRTASVYHDHVCSFYTTIEERKLGDRMFWSACRCAGCSEAEANVLYLGVKLSTLKAQLGGRDHGDKVGAALVPDGIGGWH